jgi:serine/threonine protein kinase
MHAAGVAHGDLKRKENTLVGPDETPYIIDFGIACLAQPGSRGLPRRRFEMMRQMDLNAYIKLKYGSDTAQITSDDARLFRPLPIERWARRVRVTWQTVTLRRARKRLREKRAQQGD